MTLCRFFSSSSYFNDNPPHAPWSPAIKRTVHHSALFVDRAALRKTRKRSIVTHPLLDILARYHVVGVGYWEKGERATKVGRDLGDVEGLHGGSGFELLSLSVRGV
jgi:hypothetical protein